MTKRSPCSSAPSNAARTRDGWYVDRLQLRAGEIEEAGRLQELREDARAALEQGLTPPELFTLVSAVSFHAFELDEAVRRQAAAHPRAWHAQVAALFCRNLPEVRAEMEAIARGLAPRRHPAYVARGRLVANAMVHKAASP